MTIYDTMKGILFNVETFGSIREVHLREKSEYLAEGFSVKGETMDGKLFKLNYELEDKEENHA